MTVSIGVAHRTDVNKSPEEVIKLADISLYKAKEAGRNCIRLSE